MKPGYLSVQTHDAHASLVRLVVSKHAPGPDSGQRPAPHVRYTARFNDSEAALMHAHETLKRRLVDADAHLYRTDLVQAIAAVAAIDLRHSEVYWDPAIDAATRDAIAARIERNRDAQQRWDRFFQIMGAIGIGLLLFNLLVLTPV